MIVGLVALWQRFVLGEMHTCEMHLNTRLLRADMMAHSSNDVANPSGLDWGYGGEYRNRLVRCLSYFDLGCTEVP